MRSKVLLAPITGGKADMHQLDAAFALASFTKGHVHVIYLNRDPVDLIATHMGDGMSAPMVDTLIDAAEKQEEETRLQARDTYDKWRTKHTIHEATTPDGAGRVTARYSEAIGNMAVNMTKVARLCDVVCLLRPTERVSPDWGTLVEAALFECGKPVLLAPAKKAMQPIISMAVAWNGSEEAARAVAMSMPLLEAAKQVTVFSQLSEDLDRDDLEEFAQSLVWHGISVKTKALKETGTHLAKRLQNETRKADAQLLVVGAYSHSRLRQFVFGGVTDDLLQSGEIPVLLAN